MVSKRNMAPPMTLKGVIASCSPDTTEALHNRGLDPRYIVRTRNIITADVGNDTVVGVGLGLTVTTTR
jgi:hypothetical protein